LAIACLDRSICLRHFTGPLIGSLILALVATACYADEPDHPLAREILKELVAVNTAPSGGDDTREAVALLVAHLNEAGFADADIDVLGHTEKRRDLVVRYRSASPARRPILLMAHLDVVEALPKDWHYEPFVLTEDGGWYYGRGSEDNKAGAAMLIANLIRLKKEGFEADRDVIVMLTSDEESTGDAARWLLAEHRDLVDAEFALNTDAGAVLLIEGKPLAFMLQTSEKIYASFTLEATDPGGHSSRPHRDSAISRLAHVLVDLQAHPFPIDLNPSTRAFFERWDHIAPAEDRPLLEAVLSEHPDPVVIDSLLDSIYYNALARTTCVATELSGGHAENALPQTARAVVNCRILPQSSAAATRDVLVSLAEPYRVSVTQIAPDFPSPPSPLEPDIVDPITKLAKEMWPGIAVIPEMSTGASDGAFVRNAGIPVYGVSAIADDPNDMRAHGQDERIGVRAFGDATEYWYRLVKVFATP
jgi:acetylornithine deacetylase/succinyl-diaminopimelate desuccinylase-like protein